MTPRRVLGIFLGLIAFAAVWLGFCLAAGESTWALVQVVPASVTLLLLILSGLLLLLIFTVVRRRRDQAAAVTAHPLTSPGTYGPAPKIDSEIRRPWKLRPPLQPIFHKLCQHSYVLLVVLLVLHVVSWSISPVSPKGLPVRLLRPGIQGTRFPQLEPLLLTVGDGERPTLHFNSKPIPWEELPALLDKELLRRPPDWPVYVQGDDNLEWQQVVYAIDIVRGKGAQVVLLTTTPTASPEGG